MFRTGSLRCEYLAKAFYLAVKLPKGQKIVMEHMYERITFDMGKEEMNMFNLCIGRELKRSFNRSVGIILRISALG